MSFRHFQIFDVKALNHEEKFKLHPVKLAWSVSLTVESTWVTHSHPFAARSCLSPFPGQQPRLPAQHLQWRALRFQGTPATASQASLYLNPDVAKCSPSAFASVFSPVCVCVCARVCVCAVIHAHIVLLPIESRKGELAPPVHWLSNDFPKSFGGYFLVIVPGF